MKRIEILEQIRDTAEQLSAINSIASTIIPLHQRPSPSIMALEEVMKRLRMVVFPGFFGLDQEAKVDSMHYYMGVNLEKIYDLLYEQIWKGLCFEQDRRCDAQASAVEKTVAFIRRIPHLKYLLSTDVQAIMDGDPAANSVSEVIFSYPSVLAMLHYRTAHELLQSGVPVLPRIITEMAHAATGIDIHPGAVIGEYFGIDHGTGVVIGETTIIGNHVRLYQGVTLGAKSFTYDANGLPLNVPRHPIIEDNVVIYSNTSVLGRITIGRDSVIGGNIWLTHDVLSGSKILQSTAVEDEAHQKNI